MTFSSLIREVWLVWLVRALLVEVGRGRGARGGQVDVRGTFATRGLAHKGALRERDFIHLGRGRMAERSRRSAWPGPEGFPERRRDAGAFPRDVDAFSRSDRPDVDRRTDASNRARALRRAFPGHPPPNPRGK